MTVANATRPSGETSASGSLSLAHLLAMSRIDAARDDDSGAEPGPGIREISEDEIAEHCRPDELHVAERHEERGRTIAVSQERQELAAESEDRHRAGDPQLGALGHD